MTTSARAALLTDPATESGSPEPRTFKMLRHTIVAPAVRQDGMPSRYALDLRAILARADYPGWTEYQTVGYWHGLRESGTTFELYLEADESAALALMARRVMPDQDAIQVTVDEQRATLLEA